MTPVEIEDRLVLHVENISVRFGGVRAVNNVDLKLVRGTVHGVIGPNGAGKTTLIDAITGFERVSSGGIVTFDDLDITRWRAHRRVHAGLARTFQNLELFGDLTVEENLLAARPGRGPARSLADVVELLQLESLLDMFVRDLSHGARRVLTVGRALMTSPSLLVLDEPAAGLDEAESSALGRLLRRTADGGTSILLVDHDMSLVLETCDRVTVLDFGSVLAEGTPEQIRRDPAVRAAYLGEIE